MSNGTMLQAFEWYLPADGNHLNWCAAQVSTWAREGFTALWLPPVSKGYGGRNTVGYGVYDLWDLGRYWAHDTVATQHGPLADLERLIGACHTQNMQVYADLVFNHKMGGDARQKVRVQHVDKNDKNRPLGDWHERELYTYFGFGGRFADQRAGGTPTDSYFEWHWDHFDAVEINIDNQDMTFRLKAKDFETHASDHHGGPPHLMGCDLDTSHPHVFEELCRVGEWMLGAMHFDGFRLDAVKHLRTTFFRDFMKRMHSSRSRKVFAVGEFWSDNVYHLHDYINRCDGEMHLFDVPLQKHFHDASWKDSSYDMSRILDFTFLKDRPVHAVTFVQNHDTQPRRTLEQVVKSWFVPLAYAIILLHQNGYPCVFFGDLYGVKRRDIGIEMDDHGWIIRRLLEIRRDHAYGYQRDYFDHGNVIGWTREGKPGGKGIAVIMSNGMDGWKEMDVGSGKANKQFHDWLGHCTLPITTDATGKGKFYTRGGKVSVWVEA